MDEYQKTTNTN